MNPREYVYSPMQNIALWLAAWLYGQVSFDNADDALADLEGPHRLENGDFSSVDFLKEVRAHAHMKSGSPQPALELLLGSPGFPLALPPDSKSYLSATADGAAIVFNGAEDQSYTALVRHRDLSGSQWKFFDEEGPRPATAAISLGEANRQLSYATDEAALLIASSNTNPIDAKNPRLTVSALSDFYQNPGLPHTIPHRAGKLIARADTVAAIIETVVSTLNRHDFDQELLRINRYIQQARMSAVSHAISEWARLS